MLTSLPLRKFNVFFISKKYMNAETCLYFSTRFTCAFVNFKIKYLQRINSNYFVCYLDLKPTRATSTL